MKMYVVTKEHYNDSQCGIFKSLSEAMEAVSEIDDETCWIIEGIQVGAMADFTTYTSVTADDVTSLRSLFSNSEH